MFEGSAVDVIQSLTAHETEDLVVADRMKFDAFRKSMRKFLFGCKVIISLGLSEKNMRQKSSENCPSLTKNIKINYFSNLTSLFQNVITVGISAIYGQS